MGQDWPRMAHCRGWAMGSMGALSTVLSTLVYVDMSGVKFQNNKTKLSPRLLF